MKTSEKFAEQKHRGIKNTLKVKIVIFLILLLTIFSGIPASAHCDSYDGPVIQDAIKALATNNVNLVFKWLEQSQEKEITTLFNKTFQLKTGDKEVYANAEKHFFETLVRMHREIEGAPFTGLKAAGTTKPVIKMTDEAINTGKIDEFLLKFTNHLERVVREKYQKVAELNKVKDVSKEQGRAYVAAYVDYTHTVEALHDIIEHGGGHEGHKE